MCWWQKKKQKKKKPEVETGQFLWNWMKITSFVPLQAESDDVHKLAGSGKFAADEEVLRVPIALAMIKLMKILPHNTLEHNLPG